MTAITQVDAASAAITVGTGTFATGTVITTDAIDLSASPNPLDGWVTVNFTIPASASGALNIYGIASEDGTTYDSSDNTLYNGSAGAASFAVPSVIDWKGPVVAGVLAGKSGSITFSLRQLLGSVLPRKVGFALHNACGVTITTLPTMSWTPVTFQSA